VVERALSSKRIAYVASTLPIGILDKKLNTWGINEIILQGAAHKASYEYLKTRHPFLKLRVLPRSFTLNFLVLTWILIKLKFDKGSVYFFHECCCPVFDILIKTIQPEGWHYPQVTMAGFKKVRPDEVSPTKLHRLICFLRLKDWFDFYRGDHENNEGYFFVPSIKSYPSSIIRNTLEESRQFLIESISQNKNFSHQKKIVILCGRDIVDDVELARVFSNIIDLARSLDYSCFTKDHPSAVARLNFFNEHAEVIDPSIPFELIEDDFTLVIGVASTALLRFSSRAISILKFFPLANKSARIRRVAHLANLPRGDLVRFPENLEELSEIFLNAANT
jgi:hypothetical protein